MEKNELRTEDSVNNSIKKYVNNSFLTRTPELLTLDLYDGCVRFLRVALDGFNEESYEKISNNLIRAGAIVDELNGTLNFEKGGDIAVNLRKLYRFVDHSITMSNVKKDRQKAEDALKIMQMMRDTWSEGVVKNRV
jgi:flagellar protein FliS